MTFRISCRSLAGAVDQRNFPDTSQLFPELPSPPVHQVHRPKKANKVNWSACCLAILFKLRSLFAGMVWCLLNLWPLIVILIDGPRLLQSADNSSVQTRQYKNYALPIAILHFMPDSKRRRRRRTELPADAPEVASPCISVCDNSRCTDHWLHPSRTHWCRVRQPREHQRAVRCAFCGVV